MDKSRRRTGGKTDGYEWDRSYDNGLNFDFNNDNDSDGDANGTGSQTGSHGTAPNSNHEQDSHGLESLIPFINKLQTVFRTTGIASDVIQLPQIIVVGSQSSGKSSVLESLVGRSFLPRGTGIVTRCPIILKLIQEPNGTKEWCEFLHQPKKKYSDFKEVQQEIIEQTKKIAGSQCMITRVCIQLTVHSPNVVTLTVVDLPGLVKLATGDQPDDIETQIRDLVLEYITPKNSIILAVSTANNDIVTSDSIKLARKVDPNGDRTLAILTKLDLANDKSEIMKVLKGQVIKVKLGIIGVVNRSQEDIDKNKPMREALEAEKRHLVSKYPSIASQHGAPFLAQRLHRVLLQHIESCFPEIDRRLKELDVMHKERLTELGSTMELNDEEKRHKMIDILAEFSSAYKAQIDGRSRHIDTDDACGGARIDYIFQVNLLNGLKALSPLVNTTNEQIVTAIRNSRQVGSRLYIPEDAFQELVKKQVGKMREPVLDCANQVYQEMISMVPKCLSVTAQRFPRVNRSITQILSEILHKRIQIARQVLEQYIDIQSSSALTAQANFYELMERLVKGIKVNGLGKLPLDYLLRKGVQDPILKTCGGSRSSVSMTEGSIPRLASVENFFDEDFGDAASEVLSQTQGDNRDVSGSTSSLIDDQLDACSVVRELMDAFFTIVLNQVMDYVPKSLLFTLVYDAVDNVDKELSKRLTLPEKVIDLMKESEIIVASREAVQNDLKDVEEACQMMEDIREKLVV